MPLRPSWIYGKAVVVRPQPPPPDPPPPEPAPPPQVLDVEPPAPLPPRREPTIELEAEVARLREESRALRGRIAEMAVGMARLRRDVLEASESELVRLAVSVAERVVGHELSTSPELVVAWAKEAIERLAAKDEVVIAISEDVAEAVPEESWAVLRAPHTVVTDESLEGRTVEVRTPEASVAAGPDARLAAVAEALGVETK